MVSVGMVPRDDENRQIVGAEGESRMSPEVKAESFSRVTTESCPAAPNMGSFAVLSFRAQASPVYMASLG